MPTNRYGACEKPKVRDAKETKMFGGAQWVWMDGSIVRWSDANVHISSHALHYGTAVFEGVRCYATDNGPALFRLDAHLDRFYASADVYGLEVPFSKEMLSEGIDELIRRNDFQSCYVRPICYYESNNLSLVPDKCPVRVGVLAWPWEPLLGKKAQEAGVRVTVSPWVKFHARMMPTTAKACGQYLNSVLAVREAISRGFDEALLLDTEGNISEGSGENVFAVRGKKLVTNDERDSILLGVTRDAVIRIARDFGFQVETRAIQVPDLTSADEVFLTGTAVEVTPVCSVDDKPVGSGARGPITEKIQRAFFTAVTGRDPAYREWLRLVSPVSAVVAASVT
jgi:branched-chain amino acid aminotransferase